MKKVLCVVGTRPEGIKMAPVIQALKQRPGVQVSVLATAQHRQMLDQVLCLFGIEPDIDLDVMKPNQSLTALTARILLAMEEHLRANRPDVILAQGDTTTVMATAIASFHEKIPFAHVEAGLRTGDIDNPFPEEMNRIVAGHLARWHFAPTQRARTNLLREGIPDAAIHVTGNTVIDALFHVAAQDAPLEVQLDPAKRLILVTAHRRENFGEPLAEICRAIARVVADHPDVEVLYPVHPNPNVREVVQRELSGLPRIRLCEPLDYAPFIAAMKRAHFILTDSGGVQEEAPALGKPVLVMREETERPEAIEEGVVQLVGTTYGRIVDMATRLLDDEGTYAAMAKGVSPYGDGRAAQRIADILLRE